MVDRLYRLWPATILFLAVCCYAIGFWTFRANPFAALYVFALLLPLPLALSTPRTWFTDHSLRRLIVICAIGLGWLAAITWLRSPIPLLAWEYWAVALATLFTGITVAHIQAPREAWLELIVISAAAAGAISLIGNIHHDISYFGLGNFNQITTCISPPIWAWLFYLIAKRLVGMPVSWRQWCVAGFAVITLVLFSIYAVPGYIRRGPFLALASSGTLVLIAELLRLRLYRTLIVLSSIALVGASAGGLWIYQHLNDPRLDRLMLYMSSLDLIRWNWPWGVGPYGMMSAQSVPLPWAQERIAGGIYAMHSHNEILEALGNGGLILASTVLYIIYATIKRAHNIACQPERIGMLALAGSIFSHAMVDNSYNYAIPLICLSVLLGVIWQPTPSPTPATTDTASQKKGILLAIKTTLWASVIFCAYVSTHEMSACFQHFQASPAVSYRTLEKSWNPEIIDKTSLQTLDNGFDASDLIFAHNIVYVAGEKNNWSGFLISTRMETWNAIANTLSNPNHLDDSSYIKKFYTSEQVDRELLDASLSTLKRMPLLTVAYETLYNLLNRRPDLAVNVPANWQARMVYCVGKKGLPTPNFSQNVNSFEDVIDAFVSLSWALRTGYDKKDMHQLLASAILRYGHEPSIAQAFLVALHRNPLVIESINRDTRRLELGIWNVLTSFPERLQPPASLDEKLAMTPLLRNAFSDFYSSYDNNRLPLMKKYGEKSILLHIRLLNYWEKNHR